MPLVLGFAGLLGMVLLLTSAITDASFADVIKGKGPDLYRQHEAAAAASSKGDASSPSTGDASPASTGGGGLAGAAAGDSSVTTPNASWNPLHKPVAVWIVPILNWAAQHGWSGHVISGYRSPAEQIAAATRYGLGHYPNGPLASNHVHNGAVDVSDPAGLARVLAGYRGARKLVWGGPVMGDTPHFSGNGH